MMNAIHGQSKRGHLGQLLCGLSVASAVWLLGGCGDDDSGAPGPTNTGQTCSAAEQCYRDVEPGELLGAAVCLDRVEGGYCTHLCSVDTDCCAVPGECAGRYTEVCSPFESEEEKFCFLSCEDDDWKATVAADGEAFCQSYAGPAFHCRSSGGGALNRKVCTP
jgi:hypothetical protein